MDDKVGEGVELSGPLIIFFVLIIQTEPVMPNPTIFSATEHKLFMDKVTRELDAFEQHEREFRAEDKRERLEELEAAIKEPPERN